MSEKEIKRRITIYGAIGENSIRDFIESNFENAVVTLSPDKFDREKDMTISGTDGKFDGEKIEVKTQVPYLKENLLTVHPNQIPKILGADGVFFINVPNNKFHDKYAGAIFFCRKPAELVNDFYEYVPAFGKSMVGIKRDNPKLEIVGHLKEDVIKTLKSNSVSSYNGKKFY